ncbi:MAG: hypothetical protein M0037_14040, partial [Betaproteobacteria bacterium]|nr:hypothetical protein [Betaproteobacteria bacterium]
LYTAKDIRARLKKQGVRVPAHGGHLSDLMAVSVPGPWRSAFRCDGGHFRLLPGTLTAMPGISP